MKCIVYVTVLRPTIDLPVGAMCQESPACRSGICGRCPGQTFNICIDGNASQCVDAAVSFSRVWEFCASQATLHDWLVDHEMISSIIRSTSESRHTCVTSDSTWLLFGR